MLALVQAQKLHTQCRCPRVTMVGATHARSCMLVASCVTFAPFLCRVPYCTPVQAKANGMAVAGLGDLPPVDATPAAASTAQGTASPSAGPTSQHLPAYVVRMLQLSDVNPSWLRLALAASNSMQPGGSAHQHTRPSSGTAASAKQAIQARSSGSPIHGSLTQHSAQNHRQAPAASPKPAAYTQQHVQHAQGVQEPHHQQQQQVDASKQREAAVSFLAFLRLSLSDTVLGWFQAELGEFWQNVLMHKPPWSDLQFVQLMNHHWNSTLKVRATQQPGKQTSGIEERGV